MDRERASHGKGKLWKGQAGKGQEMDSKGKSILRELLLELLSNASGGIYPRARLGFYQNLGRDPAGGRVHAGGLVLTGQKPHIFNTSKKPDG